MSDVRQFRRFILVAAVHVLVLIGLYLAWRPTFKKKPTKVIRVGLVSQAPSKPGQRSAPKPQRAAQPETKPAKPKPKPKRKSPTKPKPRPTPSPRPSPKKTSKPKKKWRARSVEDLRRELQQNQTQRPQPSRPRPDVSGLKQRLNQELSQSTHATNTLGEPVSVSDEYLQKLHDLINRKWRQPTRSEVGRGNHVVVIRLEIQRDGRITSSRIVNRSESVVLNQSVKLLLQDLHQAPPLPDDERNVMRIDIGLRLN